jgi:hypothetical protein
MHNYLKKIAELERELAPGSVWNALVAHDDSCAIFKDGECNCDPDIGLELVKQDESNAE